MRSITLFKVPAVALAGLLALGFGLTGCPDDEPGDPDGGIVDAGTDAGTEDDGGTDLIPGDTCSNAIEVVSGMPVSGDTTGMTNDYATDCGGDEAPDAVYVFTLEEDSGVEITVTGGDTFDHMFHLMTGLCLEEDILGCVDGQYPGTPEAATIPLLEAGTYYIVVDGYGADAAENAGEFTIDLNVVPGGICTADGFEGDTGNDTVADSVGSYLGAANNEIPSGDGEPPTICEGDEDWFIVGHMGGLLNINAVAQATEGTLNAEIFNATLTFGEEDVTVTQGTSLGNVPVNEADAARGYYLVHFSGTDVPPIGLPYSITLGHECEADDDDAVHEEGDDSVYARTGYNVYTDIPTGEAIPRIVCRTDVDVMGFSNIAEGDVVITLVGGENVDYEIGRVVEDVDGTEILEALTAGVTDEVVAGDKVITVTAASIGRYGITLSAAGSDTSVEYGFAVDFKATDLPPENDTCPTAEALTLAETEAVVTGRTVGATSDIYSACSGEDPADPETAANDVFYALTLTDTSNVRLSFDGSVSDFSGAVSVYQAQAECPADLSTLTPVNLANGDPACRVGSEFDLWLKDLPAGDYLVVVDGYYLNFFGFIIIKTEGGFELSTTAFPGGFPEPAVCTDAEALELPAAGTTDTITVDTTELTNDVSDYSCAAGGGNDKVYAITPTADATITVSASGFDTVLKLMTGSCLPGVGTEVACNDDDETGVIEGYGSLFTASVTAGTTYYLFIDGYDADAFGAATVNITVE